MEGRQDVTVPMPAELLEEIHDELGYGDSRAKWVRETIRMRLDGDLDDTGDTGDSRSADDTDTTVGA